jgi:AraC-like DNA-binding protein
VSLNGQAIVCTFPMPVGTKFDWHQHDEHQLAWAPEGVLVVRTHTGDYVLPPSRALWIPAGTVHETQAAGAAVLRSAYIDTKRCPIDWQRPTPVDVSPLLRELIPHLEDRSLTDQARRHGEVLLFDLLVPLAVATIDVRLPTDERASRVAQALLAEPGDGRTLHAWGRQVGASSRTLAQASLLHLAEGLPVSVVASRVGYETPSAFVAAFRAHTGVTPGRYFDRAGGARAAA